MPTPYLVSAQFAVPIQASARYKGRWQVMGKELYVDVGCTRKLQAHQAPIALPPSCSEAHAIADEQLFHQFLTSWMNGSLSLYRGFPGCHFCWDGLLQGALRSEGDVDYPEFTMNDAGRGTTCWLPTADRAIAEGVSIQCSDAHTQALSLTDVVPIGFTVQIPASSVTNLPLCWLNAGEIVVKGPLMGNQYRMCSVAWLNRGQVSFRNWPAGFGNLFLPPQRPFRPGTRQNIDQWWATCQAWMGEVVRVDAVIQVMRAPYVANRNVLAQLRQLPPR